MRAYDGTRPIQTISSSGTTDFAKHLRRLRTTVGLSQEALAESAGLSVDAVSRYERGLRLAPRPETIAALADALQLDGEARSEFETIARRKSSRGAISPKPSEYELPWQTTSFVGRTREVAAISGLLAPRRLVTVTGAGGIGKTRTSLEAASLLPKSITKQARFVDFAPIGDGALAPSKIASVLGMCLPEQRDPLGALIDALKIQELLLILDNCEHIIDAVRKLASAVLAECPKITLLATSRERLGIAGEMVYQLPTLPILGEALTLFAERAAACDLGFTLSDEHVEASIDICSRLDGIALAIELAAARLPVLGIQELRAQLAKHFGVIAGGSHDLPARQQTLNATISWSHNLLDHSERTLFRRLAIFASGWTLEAAEAVCADDELDRAAVFDALLSLVGKSLVVVDLDAPTRRYVFFESTRSFALERLVESGEELTLSQRHARWMATFADRAYDSYGSTPRPRWEAAIAPELDNALSALDFSFGRNGDILVAATITGGLQGLWLTAGLAVRGRSLVSNALERLDADAHPALVARLLLALYRFGRGESNLNVMERAIALLERVGDRRTLARCYTLLSYTLAQIGRYEQAEEFSNRALDLIYEEGLQTTPLYVGFLNDRSTMFRAQGRLHEARSALAESLSVALALGDDWLVSRCQIIFADIEFAAGETRSAVSRGEEALATVRRIAGSEQEVYVRCNLACYQLLLGDIDTAETNARKALALARTSSPTAVQAAIQHLATVAALRSQPEHAARLLGHVNAWYERTGNGRDLTDRKGYDLLVDSLRAQLSEDALASLDAQGARLTEEAAINEAACVR